MSSSPVSPIVEHFESLQDPREANGKRHLLLDMLVVAICAVICGADNWVEIESFGHAKFDWLSQFLSLPHGIASHDTFGRVFACLSPEQFQACFLSWIQAVASITEGQVVAIDGKNLRRSHDRTLGKSAIYMVSAWAEANRLVLGQRKVDDKSNEITAVPQLLQVLDIAGCIVTTDAMGCQKKIVDAIREQDADYVLAVKENQGGLYDSIEDLFAYANEIAFQDVIHDVHETVNKGHGRIEIRQCWTITDPTFLAYVPDLDKWRDLNTLIMVQSERREASETTHKTRYYISSLGKDAKRALHAVRRHWSIENELHWVLDIAFREDESRVRKGYGAQNLAILRHIALNLLKQDTTAKGGIKAKRLQAAWNEDYLASILSGLST
jgi:predicted transposase YbfD/YdcC